MQRFAGVLPYGYNQAGCLFLLLAKEKFGRDAGLWSGFAGRPEEFDGGDALMTAAREGFEESCGLLGTKDDLATTILPKYAHVVKVPTGQHYLLPMQHSTYLPYMFKGAQAALTAARNLPPETYSAFLEKTAIRWFSEQELKDAPGCLRPGFQEDLPVFMNFIAGLRDSGAPA